MVEAWSQKTPPEEVIFPGGTDQDDPLLLLSVPAYLVGLADLRNTATAFQSFSLVILGVLPSLAFYFDKFHYRLIKKIHELTGVSPNP